MQPGDTWSRSRLCSQRGAIQKVHEPRPPRGLVTINSTKKRIFFVYVCFKWFCEFLSARNRFLGKFPIDIGVQMWSWDEISRTDSNFETKIIFRSRFQNLSQTIGVCWCVQLTNSVHKWEMFPPNSLGVFSLKTIIFRVTNQQNWSQQDIARFR